jgi:molybdopterin converting factor small subunit
LVRVTAIAPLSAEFFGGEEQLELDARSVFELVRQLDARSPGFADAAESRVAFAVDGEVALEWAKPLGAGSQVLLVPRIAGG